MVRHFLSGIPQGREIIFFGTGEFLCDPNYLYHIKTARELGHQPCILTNGKLLTHARIDELLANHIRVFRISADGFDDKTNAKNRHGSNFESILEAFRYLNSKKSEFPDIRCEVNCVAFANDPELPNKSCNFWAGKVDWINMGAEIYDKYKFRNLFFEPDVSRTVCNFLLMLHPTGYILPCCRLVYTEFEHAHNKQWLAHIDRYTPLDAYNHYAELYNTERSPMANICNQCEMLMYSCLDSLNNSPVFQNKKIAQLHKNTDPFDRLYTLHVEQFFYDANSDEIYSNFLDFPKHERGYQNIKLRFCPPPPKEQANRQTPVGFSCRIQDDQYTFLDSAEHLKFTNEISFRIYCNTFNSLRIIFNMSDFINLKDNGVEYIEISSDCVTHDYKRYEVLRDKIIDTERKQTKNILCRVLRKALRIASR
jgi:hypothetical protein